MSSHVFRMVFGAPLVTNMGGGGAFRSPIYFVWVDHSQSPILPINCCEICSTMDIERVQFSIVPGARLFSLGKRILTRHPCESSLVFYRRKSPKINKRVHFLTNPPKNAHPHQPHAFCVGRARAGPRPDCLLAAHPCAGSRGPRPRDITKPVSIVQCY